jgi:NAD(P)-dependent dehydrogenase (short-subunit alcohol dehydrogenase family)
MNLLDGSVALITGANTGIGKEVAKQMAVSGKYKKIILACRNRSKAEAAKINLESSTGKAIFQIVIMDVSDPKSVTTVLNTLDPIDDLIMNAGGSGGKTPLALTKDGVTEIFASNVFGHAVLLEGLIKTGKLKRSAVYVGSEAARGVPKLGMKRPSLTTSSTEEFASLCDGTYFQDRKKNPTLAYGQVKYVGAMWMAFLARKNPGLKLITMSPGNTRGTEGMRDLPFPIRLILKYVLTPVVMPLFGLVHDVNQGAKRIIDGLENENFKSGVFYASRADALIGPVINQSEIFSDLSNESFQENAFKAVSHFLEKSRTCPDNVTH